MTYNFHSRLDHAGTRFKAMGELFDISRGGTTVEDVVLFPVLQKGEEFIPGVAVTRIEFQDFFVDLADLGILGLPLHGDILTRQSTGETFQVRSGGTDEPAFQFVTSNRNRVQIHTDRTGDPT